MPAGLRAVTQIFGLRGSFGAAKLGQLAPRFVHFRPWRQGRADIHRSCQERGCSCSIGGAQIRPAAQLLSIEKSAGQVPVERGKNSPCSQRRHDRAVHAPWLGLRTERLRWHGESPDQHRQRCCRQRHQRQCDPGSPQRDDPTQVLKALQACGPGYFRADCGEQ